jgi:hypothetical protein
MVTYAKEYVQQSGKMDRAKAQVEKEEAKRRDREARKAERATKSKRT